MNKMKIYTPEGYPDIDYMVSHNCPLVVIISGRGTGKTFSILDYYLRNNKKFIYLRRTKTQMICACDTALNVFKNINLEKGYNIQGEFKRDTYAEFYDYSKNPHELVSVGAPLGTFYNVRGFSAADFGDLFFDEITPEAMEKVSSREEKAFLNVIESVNRNRELKGEKPIQMILAGNADTLNSPILRALDLVKITEKMVSEGREEYINRQRGVAIYWLVNSPIAQKKADTFLYQNTKNKAFKAMALENRFRDLDSTKKSIKIFPPEHLFPLYSINDNFFVYKIKSEDALYVCEKNYSVKKNYNFLLTDERKRYIIQERKTLEMAVMQKIFYETFDARSRFEELIF